MDWTELPEKLYKNRSRMDKMMWLFRRLKVITNSSYIYVNNKINDHKTPMIGD